LREDEPKPGGLARPPSAIAPEFVDGFFVVPRLGAMEEA
jgi:Asp-tRNA(Asn)/Glu-tRNA(Gln) amidotransferase C subunit